MKRKLTESHHVLHHNSTNNMKCVNILFAIVKLYLTENRINVLNIFQIIYSQYWTLTWLKTECCCLTFPLKFTVKLTKQGLIISELSMTFTCKYYKYLITEPLINVFLVNLSGDVNVFKCFYVVRENTSVFIIIWFKTVYSDAINHYFIFTNSTFSTWRLHKVLIQLL